MADQPPSDQPEVGRAPEPASLPWVNADPIPEDWVLAGTRVPRPHGEGGLGGRRGLWCVTQEEGV